MQIYQDKVKEGFGPLLPSFLHIPFNDIKALEEVMNEEVAAVMVEVVQGEGGVIPADLSFLKEIETLCNKFGSLFIIDEVQTGIGRTGTLFAYEQVRIEPDIVTVAKALGNGIPVGAMITGKSSERRLLQDHTVQLLAGITSRWLQRKKYCK